MKICFIAGPGRSGTKAIADALGSVDGITCFHQHETVEMARLGAEYRSGWIDPFVAAEAVKAIYEPAMKACNDPIFIDVSNKISWLVIPLGIAFPDAKFATVIRDGRAVVSSYYHKLPEVYGSSSITTWAYLYQGGYQPDNKERFWWPVQKKGWTGYNRIQRLAWHWVNNIHSAHNAAWSGPLFHLERLAIDPNLPYPYQTSELVNYLELPSKAVDALLDRLRKPHNVIRPEHIPLTPEQENDFWRFPGAHTMMKAFGYIRDHSYGVKDYG